MADPDGIKGWPNRCHWCGLEFYQCKTQRELGYGRCCYYCNHVEREQADG